MNNQDMPSHISPPTSAPAIHEISTFLPGRLEFEHEIDNEAEDLVKDLEFGVVSDYGGDQIIEDENDVDVLARAKLEKEKRLGIFTGFHNPPAHAGKAPPPANGLVNGYHVNGDIKKVKMEDISNGNGEDEAEEPVQPPPFETKDSLAFKLTLLEMYFQRIDKRLETKAVIFERGLLEYKKVFSHFHRSSQSTNYNSLRCKLRKRNGLEKNENLCTGYVLLQGYNQLKIMKPFLLICSVRTRHSVCNTNKY